MNKPILILSLLSLSLLGAAGSLLPKVKSSLDELEVLTKIVFSNKKTFTLNLEVKENLTPGKISLIEKNFKTLRDDVYQLSKELTSEDFTEETTKAKEVITASFRTYVLLLELYKTYIISYHRSNLSSHFKLSNLDLFKLKLDKRVALELLSKNNIYARHLDRNTIELAVNEETKQSFELMALEKPKNVTSYGKLVQFLSIREMLGNKWSIERMQTTKVDDPSLNYCGKNMLSFTPGADSSGVKKMSSSKLMIENGQFDLYMNNFAPLIEKVVDDSIKYNVLDHAKGMTLLDQVISGIPTIEYTFINDFMWTQDEVFDFKNEVTESLMSNEKKEWEAYAETILNVSTLSGDSFKVSELVKNISQDVYQTKVEAINIQLFSIFDYLPKEDKQQLKIISAKYFEDIKANWAINFEAKLYDRLKSLGNAKTLAANRKKDKIDEVKETLKLSLTSAWFQNYIISKKLQNKSLNLPKIAINDLEPKTPSELQAYLQSKMMIDLDFGSAFAYTLNNSSEMSSLLTNYLEKIQTRFLELKTTLSHKEYQKNLFNIAYDEAFKLMKLYPYTFEEMMSVETRKELIAVSDNTRVHINIPQTVKIPKNNCDDKNKSRASATDVASKYDLLNSLKINPMAADNTRVAVQKVIKNVQKADAPCIPQYDIIDLRAHEKLITDKKLFYHHLFRLLNIYSYSQPSSATPSSKGSFLNILADQQIIADLRLADTYNVAPLLKIPLVRTHSVPAGKEGTRTVTEEKPALNRMLGAITINSIGDHSIDFEKIKPLIEETLTNAEKNLKGQTEIFCKADYTKPEEDTNFKKMFKAVTTIRNNITGSQSMSEDEQSIMMGFDEDLRMKTRSFNEMVNEEYVEPMMMVMTVLVIISVLIIPFMGWVGIMSPGLALGLITTLDAVDFAITGASFYFRTAQNFYEVPAQMKFQKSLATSQISGFSLTSWDDVSAAQKENKTQKIFQIALTPLDLFVGYRFFKVTRQSMGITGANALKKWGMPKRGFGTVPKVKKSNYTLKKIYFNKGYKGVITYKTKEMLDAAKKWLPRYQPYTKTELTHSLRLGLVSKARELGLDQTPWLLKADSEVFSSRLKSRLDISTSFDKETKTMMEKARLKGSFTFKEFIAKTSYSKEMLIPRSFIKAVKQGKALDWLSNYDQYLDSINNLRGKYLNKKVKIAETIQGKLDDVKKAAIIDNKFYVKSGHQSPMDYFISLLSDDELKVFEEMAKSSKADFKSFKVVFKEHKDIMENIVPVATLDGKLLPSQSLYPSFLTHKALLEVQNQLDDESDLKTFYQAVLENDAIGSESEEILNIRKSIEEGLF